MAITVEAVYENGVLKPSQTLPLKEHETVRVTVQSSAEIQAALEAVKRGYGLLGWTGDSALIEQVALDPEFSSEEAP